MKYQKEFSLLTALSLTLALLSTDAAVARGGGGGGRGGFGGGGFAGRSEGGWGGGERADRGEWGGFNRDFDRGFDDGPFSPRADGSSFNNGATARVDTPRVSESELRAAADHDYGVLSADKGYGMASDGGFGRNASTAISAAAARNVGATTNRVSSADLVSRASSVRSDFRNYDTFDRNWWNTHPGSWYYPGWRDGWPWYGVGWDDLGGYWGVTTDPVEYDYGDNITYQNEEVYYGNQPTATAATYYTQAQVLADTTPTTPSAKDSANDWKALGVYSLTQGSQSNTTMLFQLAVNKTGEIRGNYYNVLTQETKPVHGAVDKKDMRCSWVVGTNKSVVYDTGVANLLKSQSTVLVHLSKTQTQQWNLIKLNPPSKA